MQGTTPQSPGLQQVNMVRSHHGWEVGVSEQVLSTDLLGLGRGSGLLTTGEESQDGMGQR